MSALDRRHFLKGLLGKLAQVTGAVVVASAATSKATAENEPSEENDTPQESVEERANRLAADSTFEDAEEAETAGSEFLNFGGFRNTPLGGFRNGPIGGF